LYITVTFLIWFRKKMEKIIRCDRVSNEVVSYGVNGDRNILLTIKRRKA